MKVNRTLILNSLLIVILFMSCKKEDNNPTPTPNPTPTIVIPSLTTTAISAITTTSASSGGAVTSDGGAAVSAWGVCWSTSANPTLANSFLQNNEISGGFSSTLSGLTLNTTYYVRAYATNSAGTAYGNELSFTTANIVLLSIGQSYQGGKIAYILQAGDYGYDATIQHGLIAAPNDQSTGAPWGTGCGDFVGLCNDLFIGTGGSNTDGIISSCQQAVIAARICGDLVLGGYSDWFLPSRDELLMMYYNKLAIGGFANDYYWSSSQNCNDMYMDEIGLYAWWVLFSNGVQGWGDKNAPDYVRAARYF